MSNKLLLVTTEFPPFPGGIATYSYNMVRYAKKCGYDVSVLGPVYDYNNKNDFEFHFTPWIKNGFSKKKILFSLYKLNKKLKPNFDLIHASDWPSILLLDLLNKVKKQKIPYIATIYGTDIFVFKKMINKYSFLKHVLFKQCRKIHFISKYTYNLAIENMDFLLQDKEHIIQKLGIDENYFLKKGAVDVYTKFNVPKNKKIILSVSRLDDRKGHLDAIKALDALPENLKKDFVYVLVGKIVDNKYYRKLLNVLEKSSFEYKYLGVVSFEELLSLYENSYLFLLPGRYVPEKVEGFGLVYVEAAAKGLPSVAYKIHAIPEVIVHGKTGFLAEEGDIKMLANYIKLLLVDKELHESMSREAYKFSRKFSWESCVKSLYGTGKIK